MDRAAERTDGDDRLTHLRQIRWELSLKPVPALADSMAGGLTVNAPHAGPRDELRTLLHGMRNQLFLVMICLETIDREGADSQRSSEALTLARQAPLLRLNEAIDRIGELARGTRT